MEIEAWFLSEWHHFSQINSCLTPDRIQEEFGFNPKTDDMEERPHPTEDLNKIYQLVGEYYDKRKTTIEKVINALNFKYLQSELHQKVPSLKSFLEKINYFFES